MAGNDSFDCRRFRLFEVHQNAPYAVWVGRASCRGIGAGAGLNRTIALYGRSAASSAVQRRHRAAALSGE